MTCCPPLTAIRDVPNSTSGQPLLCEQGPEPSKADGLEACGGSCNCWRSGKWAWGEDDALCDQCCCCCCCSWEGE